MSPVASGPRSALPLSDSEWFCHPLAEGKLAGAGRGGGRVLSSFDFTSQGTSLTLWPRPPCPARALLVPTDPRDVSNRLARHVVDTHFTLVALSLR